MPQGQQPPGQPQMYPQQQFMPAQGFMPGMTPGAMQYRPQYQQFYPGGPRPFIQQQFMNSTPGYMVQPTPPMVYTQNTRPAAPGATAGTETATTTAAAVPAAAPAAAPPKRKSTAIKIMKPGSKEEVKIPAKVEPVKEPAAAAAPEPAAAPATAAPEPAAATMAEAAKPAAMTPNTERRTKQALKIERPPKMEGEATEEAPAAESEKPATAAAAAAAPPVRAKDKKKAALAKAEAGTPESTLDAFTDETREKLVVTKKETKPNVIPSGKEVQAEEVDVPEAADNWEEKAPEAAYPSGLAGPNMWTPTNTSGDKRYPLGFMMAFRPVCAQPPPDFRSDLRDMMSAGQRSGPRSGGGNFKQMQGWMAPEHSTQGGAQFGRPGAQGGAPPKRQSGQGRPPRSGGNSQGPGGKRVINLNRGSGGGGGGGGDSGASAGGLKKAEHAWGGSKASADGKSPAQVAIGILNKLTLEKFDALSDKLISHVIANMDDLDSFVAEVFSKAIDEEFFAMIYARLCRKMADAKVPGKEDKAIDGFKKILLNRCQKEFEAASKADSDSDAKEAAAKAKKEKDAEAEGGAKKLSPEETKKIREEEREAGYAKNKVKRHMLGNIKFIGELFKADMVTEKILRHCIKHLMPNAKADEENMENLCKLLETAGGKLEITIERKKKPADIKDLLATFKLMEEISNRKGLSSRIKFAVKDILEMRARRWKQRGGKANVGPKLISEVHQEAAVEQANIQEKNSGRGAPPPGRNSRGSDGGRPKAQSYQGNQGRGKDQWSTVPTSNRPEMVDSSRMLQSTKKLGGITLGGKLGGLRAPKLGAPGKVEGGKYVSAQDTAKNGFAALASTSSGPPKPSGSPMLKQKSMSLMEKSAALKAGRSDTPESGRGSPASSTSSPATSVVAVVKVAPCKFSKEDLEPKITGCLNEFMSIEDMKEVTLSIAEWGHADATLQFVETALNISVEAKPTDRAKLVKLMTGLVGNPKGVPAAIYVTALTGFFEFVPDLQYDAPKVTEYVGDFMAAGLKASPDVAPVFAALQSADTQDALGGDTALKIGLLAFASLKKSSGADAMVAAFSASGISLESLLPEGRRGDGTVADLCDRRDVKELLSAPAAGGKSLSASLAGLIGAKASNDEVFSWIDENVPEADRSAPAFVSALASVVLAESVKQTTCPSAEDAGKRPSAEQTEQEQTVAKGRMPLLIKYTDNSASLQLHVVCSVQACVTGLKNPQQMMERWFEYLYDFDVVPEDVFLQWEGDTEVSTSAEYPGKNSALIGAKQLLERLKTTEEEEDPQAP